MSNHWNIDVEISLTVDLTHIHALVVILTFSSSIVQIYGPLSFFKFFWSFGRKDSRTQSGKCKK